MRVSWRRREFWVTGLFSSQSGYERRKVRDGGEDCEQSGKQDSSKQDSERERKKERKR